MTTEIAILNSTAVALAADSAVTVGKRRVWNNSKKLFRVSEDNDIGIMIHGSGSHIGIPWETIIKLFRKHVAGQRFDTVQECANLFLDYCDSLTTFDETLTHLNSYDLFISIIGRIAERDGSNKRRFKVTLRNRAQELIDEIHENGIQVVNEEYSFNEFLGAHSEAIDSLLTDEIELKLSKPAINTIKELLYEAFRRRFPTESRTGVVFCGFGETELFPYLVNYIVDGKIGEKTRAWPIFSRDLNSKDCPRAAIVPFGQSDVARLFMEGIQGEHLKFLAILLKGQLDEFIKSNISRIGDQDTAVVEEKIQERVSEKLVKSFFEEFSDFRQAKTTNEMMKVVLSLPKEEMANLAESIVDLTALRRKMDSPIETVGGPIDVAVISKGDGFVWIRRKHYFDLALNQNFLGRRARRNSARLEE